MKTVFVSLLFVAAFITSSAQITKRVLLEEFTYSTCGNCPEAALVIDTLLIDYANLIVVSHHTGGTGTSDSMTVTESYSFADDFGFGAPTATVDRVKFNGESNVAVFQTKWRDKVIDQLATPAAVSVAIAGTWSQATSMIDMTITANFDSVPPSGDFRINAFIVEDGIIGSGSGYDQWNLYNTLVGHPLYGAGDPILNYEHNHVLRAVPSGTWGTASVIPITPVIATDYSQNYNYILPGNYDENKIKIVAFVSYYNAAVDQREILNANSIALSQLATSSVKEIGTHRLKLTPNPFEESMTIELPQEFGPKVELQISDLYGRVLRHDIENNSGSIWIDRNELKSGIYLLKVNSANGHQSTAKFVIK